MIFLCSAGSSVWLSASVQTLENCCGSSAMVLMMICICLLLCVVVTVTYGWFLVECEWNLRYIVRSGEGGTMILVSSSFGAMQVL